MRKCDIKLQNCCQHACKQGRQDELIQHEKMKKET